MKAKHSPERRAMARMAADLSDTKLDADAPRNRTTFPYRKPDGVPDDLVRAHRAHGVLDLTPVPKLQRVCAQALGHDLTDDDARVYVTRLAMASRGPLNHMRRVSVSAYELLAAVVCQPYLGALSDLDADAGAIHDVFLFGHARIPRARACLDRALACLAGDDVGGPMLTLRRPTVAPPPAVRAVQQELFA